MKFDPALVVNPPPIEGSVLSRYVAEQSCLEILYILEGEAFLASVRAGLAALRRENATNQLPTTLVSKKGIIWGTVDETLCKANRKHGRAFLPFGGNEPYTEINQIPDFQPLERKKDSPSNSLIADPVSQQTHHFPTMVYVSVGVKNGHDLGKKVIVRVVDGVEDSTGYVWQNRPKKKVVSLPNEPVDYSRETFMTLYGESPRSATGANPRRGETLEEYAARHKNDELGTYLPNWCPTCQQYVKWRHDGPTGIPCEDYLKTIEADEAKRVATMYAPTEQVVPCRDRTSCGDGPTNTNWVEDRWIARLDRNKALRRLFAKCEPCVEDAPKVRKGGRKPKRHYVRHGAADLSFVRKQDLELATEF